MAWVLNWLDLRLAAIDWKEQELRQERILFASHVELEAGRAGLGGRVFSTKFSRTQASMAFGPALPQMWPTSSCSRMECQLSHPCSKLQERGKKVQRVWSS